MPKKDYDHNSWMLYRETTRQHEAPDGDRIDYGAFLPSPDEILERIIQLEWLQENGFDNAFICSVMQHECPCFEVVERMIARHGPLITYYKLEAMLETGGYTPYPPTESTF